MSFRRAITNGFTASFVPVLLGGILLAPIRTRAAAPPQPVLVELFTSEGCSSCPPADRLLMELDRKQPVPEANIIVLSEHVDYWNSLGWRDPFSSAGWSERQNEYARRLGLASVYTPQIIVGGTLQAVGSDDRSVIQAIQKSANGPHLVITISELRRANDHLELSYSVDAAPHATLYAALADASDRSSVQRGENAGHTLDHVAVARSLDPLSSLKTASSGRRVDVAVPGDDADRPVRLILFAQDTRTGAILGVVEREL